MSNTTDSNQTWVNEYQARFGAAPGTQDAKAELERCVHLCQELLTERERLRAELARVQADYERYHQAFCGLMDKELAKLIRDEETLLADAVFEPSIDEIIAELRQDGEG